MIIRRPRAVTQDGFAHDFLDEILVLLADHLGAVRHAVPGVDRRIGVNLQNERIALFIDADLDAGIVVAVEEIVGVQAYFLD